MTARWPPEQIPPLNFLGTIKSYRFTVLCGRTRVLITFSSGVQNVRSNIHMHMAMTVMTITEMTTPTMMLVFLLGVSPAATEENEKEVTFSAGRYYRKLYAV